MQTASRSNKVCSTSLIIREMNENHNEVSPYTIEWLSSKRQKYQILENM